MAHARRASMTCVVIACLLCTELNGLVFASDSNPTPAPQPPSAADVSSQAAHTLLDGTANLFVEPPASRRFTLPSVDFRVDGGQVYQRRPYPMGRHDTSLALVMVGAVAAITGTAVLVYANRPECSMNEAAGGCGYGTKVVGTSVLAGGIVSLFVGALTWH